MNFLVRTGEAYWNYLKAAFDLYLFLAGIFLVLGIISVISAIKGFRSKKKH